MEYYFPTKRNGVLLPSTTCMNLKNMLSGKSQSQKTTHCMIPLVCNVQHTETEGRLGLGVGTWGRTANRYDDENVLSLDYADG